MVNTLEVWHSIIASRDTAALSNLLAENVRFHSPVVHKPYVGKEFVQHVLMAACDVLLNGSFKYVREVVGANDAILEFHAVVDEVEINGVDMIEWNGAGQITDFKVMIRPLKAIEKIQQEMFRRLSAAQASESN